MSLALIQESATEVRRLAIAGSPLAVSDFRLKKLVTPLEQAGAKVPVFAQIAKAIGEVVNGNEADSAARLLSLSTLLNAVLYTQGQTGTEAGFQELEMLNASTATTRTSARVLKPIIEALTTTGGGRFEVVKEAVDRGAFNDLRLIDPAIRALEDSYPGLADLVAEKILPAYGPCIVPLLKQKLNLKGNKSDARRLRVLHQLDSTGSIELCKTALEEGSPEVKVCAIACLGKHEDCIPLVMEQSNSKNKAIRAAALEALAGHDRPEIVKLFLDLISGKTFDILAQPFRAIRNRQVLGSLLGEAKSVFELLLKGDEEQILRFLEILDCLKERKETEVEEFLIICFAQSDKLGKFKAPKKSPFISYSTGADILDRMASLLYEIGSPAALESVLTKRDVLPTAAFTQVLYSALRIWSAEKVYQEFAPLLEQGKGPGKEKIGVLQQTIRTMCGGFVCDSDDLNGDPGASEAQSLAKPQWDPRWLDAAIKADQSTIVCCLAKPGDQAAVAYLLKLVDAKSQSNTNSARQTQTLAQSGLVIRTLARCQYPKLTEVYLDLIARRTTKAQYVDYDLQLLFQSARFLPAADLPKLDAFAAKLDEKFVDKFLEALEPLRPNKQSI